MSTLLITSSVKVIAPQTAVNDDRERLEQYIAAIRKWIINTRISRIVVCDNSGFIYDRTSFEELGAAHGTEVEFLSFLGDQQKIKMQGKGYGEGEIIRYALENSQLLQQSTGFFKVTGRVFITNYNRLSRFVKADQAYFNLGINASQGNYIDTRFYYCPVTFYKQYLLTAFEQVDDLGGYVLENAFHTALKAAVYRRFFLAPDFEGVSGSTGKNYRERRPVFYVRAIINSIYQLLGK